jgi:hypothetical protein
MSQPLSARVFEAFSGDIRATPPLTLRGGYVLDGYKKPEAFDAAIDTVSDNYFERYWWGLAHLDPRSWRYYVPHLIEYSLRRRHEHSLVVDGLLTSVNTIKSPALPISLR